MPFDPTKPAFGAPDSSAEMRDQLNRLKELIEGSRDGSLGMRLPFIFPKKENLPLAADGRHADAIPVVRDAAHHTGEEPAIS